MIEGKEIGLRLLLCENLCEKNFPKSAKIGKNRKKPGKSYLTITAAYNNLRRLGNSEVITVNHCVRGSSPCWGATFIKRPDQTIGPFCLEAHLCHTGYTFSETI